MLRPVCLMLAVFVVGLGPAGAQTQLAPLYSLPKDGTWVEYEWTATGPDKKEQQGTLRISSVGGNEVQGAPHRWVEVKKVTTQDNQKCRFRKLLVAEKDLLGGRPLHDSVVLGFDRGDSPDSVTRLSAGRLSDFLSMGFKGPAATFRDVQDREYVSAGLGKFLTSHVSARGQAGHRILEYHGWLTDEVAFGWVKFQIREQKGAAPSQIVFTAVAIRSGQGATSDLDESKAK